MQLRGSLSEKNAKSAALLFAYVIGIAVGVGLCLLFLEVVQ